MANIRTCLWFEKEGAKAAKFYCDLIPNSGFTSSREPADDAFIVSFELDGAPYQIMSAGPRYKLNEAASISYMTESQAETDRVWEALLEGGGVEMPCAWLKDRFGVSWQIVPQQLIDALTSDDREGAARAQAAMLEMKKIDIAKIEAAFRGEPEGMSSKELQEEGR